MQQDERTHPVQMHQWQLQGHQLVNPPAGTQPRSGLSLLPQNLPTQQLILNIPARLHTALPVISQTNCVLWDQELVSRLSRLFNLNVLPPTSTAISLPADTIIEGTIVDGADGSAPVIAAFTTQTGHVITSFGPGQDIKSISFREVAGISVQGSHPNRDYNSIEVTLRVNRCSLIRGSECRPSSKLESAISAPSDHRTTETAANMITDLARTAASANTGIPLAASASSNGGPSATTSKGALINDFDKTKEVPQALWRIGPPRDHGLPPLLLLVALVTLALVPAPRDTPLLVVEAALPQMQQNFHRT